MISITNGVLTATVSVLLDKAAQSGVDSALQEAVQAAVASELKKPEHRKALAAIARRLVTAEIARRGENPPTPEPPATFTVQPSPYSSPHLPKVPAPNPNIAADYEAAQAAAANKALENFRGR